MAEWADEETSFYYGDHEQNTYHEVKQYTQVFPG